MGSLPSQTPTPASSQPDVRAALDFSQALAQQELKSIERIHNRTMVYVTSVLTIVGLGLGAIGWFGYANLRNIAVGVASRQVQDEVQRQVKSQLAAQKVDEVVKQQIGQYSQTELNSQISRAIQSGELRKEILEAAARESSLLLSRAFAQRKLTSSQRTRFIASLKSKPDLASVSFQVGFQLGSPESEAYAREIQSALSQGGFHLQNPNMYGGMNLYNVVTGVSIQYPDVGKEASLAEQLKAAFDDAGVSATLHPWEQTVPPRTTAPSPPVLEVWIGVEHIRLNP